MTSSNKVWWVLKLLSGLALIGCLLAPAAIVINPGLLQRVGPWLAAMLGSAAAYWFADRRLRAAALLPAPVKVEWRGAQFVLPAPLVRQAALCVGLSCITVGLGLAAVRDGLVQRWETVCWLLGALFGAWITRAGVLGLLRMRRAGFALKLDSAGIHYPGLPLLPWSQVRGLALDPPRPDSEQSQHLVVQIQALPDQPSGLRALWRAALPGATVRREQVRLPLPTLSKSAPLLAAAEALWRRHGQPVLA